MTKKDNHGANLFELSKKYNFKLTDIRDFSSNINPLGPSKLAIEKLSENLNLVTTYPDPGYIDLKNSLSQYINSNSEDIFLGSGTTELLREYIYLVNPKNSLLLSPCYSEYENELKKINSNIHYYNLKEENNFEINVEEIIQFINANNINLLIFANPNNPTGTILTKDSVEKILKSTSTKILLDETYVEFTDTKIYSSVPLTKKYENLFVTRGVSKFFASPGIRLGYGITSDVFTKEEFSKKEMLWNINIFADIMGQYMFKDFKYQEEVFKFIRDERTYMIEELSKISNIEVFNSQGNFVLCKITNEKTAQELRNELLKSALVIRDCSSFLGLSEKYFRFCILDLEDNRKLINKIKEIME